MPTALLYLPLKIPVRFDLVQPLAHWLDDDDRQTGFGGGGGPSYSSSSSSMPADYTDTPMAWVVPKPTYSSIQCRSELLRIAALRNCLSEHLQDSHKSALENEMLRDCQDYHATLLEFEKRGFPTSEYDDTDNGINLTWKGAFGTKQQETHNSLLWDRACTLWNVAALQSSMAALEGDVKTREGLRLAISNLQQAASLLSLCRQLMDSQNEYVSTVDLSKPMLSFWEKLCLAQAQMCIYKLANLGGEGSSTVRNHTTLAYLIQGAAPLYNDALSLSQDNRLQSDVPAQCQEWAAHCKAMSLLCQGRAYFHMSIEHRLSKSAHGMEIARLQQAISTFKEVSKFCSSTQVLKEATKLVSSLSPPRKRGGGGGIAGTEVSPMAAAAATIQPEVESLLKLAQDRLVAADDDNVKIYMDSIPPPSSLPDIRPQVMVKTDLPLPETMLSPRANLFSWDR